MTKKIRITLVILFGLALLLTAGWLIRDGILVKPTAASLAKGVEFPKYDVLQWQAEREAEILEDYAAGVYTLQDPYILVDPYEMNPCSALVIFEAATAGDFEITILGDDDLATYRYVKTSRATHVELPIIGLYAGRENKVVLIDSQGNIAQLSIETEPLPVDFPTYSIEKAEPAKMEPGITMFIALSERAYTTLMDHNGAVRGYLAGRNRPHGTSLIQLENGNLMTTGDEYKQIPYNMASLWEFNWLGKIFREYEIPNAVHHDIEEMPNGDILAVSNNRDMFNSGTREDVVIVIDRETGEITREYDFRKILDETRDPVTHFHPNIKNINNADWMHANAANFVEAENLIIVSAAVQSQVVAIDAATAEIRWILGPHEGYEGASAYLRQYLLTPVGSTFEWQWAQHEPMLLPDFDFDPDTLDLMLFDNGQSRSFYKENEVPPELNYSRGVHYRINEKEMTVEQIWQYGKECGVQCYATFLGDADYLPVTGNRLITFGGQIFSDGARSDEIVSTVMGLLATRSVIREVTGTGEVVFSVSVSDNANTSTASTYQAERMPLFSAPSFDYRLGDIQAERVGRSYTSQVSDMIQAPLFYMGDLEVIFDRAFIEGERLVVDGHMLYQGKTYLLGRALFILRSQEHTYVYAANPGLNSRFFMSLDLNELAPGSYQLSIAGGVVEGNDYLGKQQRAHVKTPYVIHVP
jgi:arylsulfate sulfotransferase